MGNLTRRSVLAGGLGLGTSMLVNGTSWAQQRFEGVTLNMNGYGGAWDDVLMAHAIPQLEADGLEVIIQPGGSSAAVARAIASRDNPPFDVMMCDSPSMPELINAEVISEVTEAEVPNIANLIPGIREFGDYGVPIAISSVVIVYNHETVANPPQSIMDLANPEFEGRVGMFNLENTGGVLGLIALAEANGGGVDNIDPGFDALQRIKPNFANITNSTATLIQMFEQGEADVGVIWNGRVTIMQETGVPVGHVIPEEGLYSLQSYLSLVTNSSNQEAGLALLDAGISEQTSSGFARDTFYSGTNMMVSLEEDEAAAVLNYGEAARNSLKTPSDWVQVAEGRPEWIERWNREIAR